MKMNLLLIAVLMLANLTACQSINKDSQVAKAEPVSIEGEPVNSPGRDRGIDLGEFGPFSNTRHGAIRLGGSQ
jgi:hypothetical protein